MVATFVISSLVCLGILGTSLFKPSISIKGHRFNLFWMIALLGAIILLASLTLPFDVFINGLVDKNSINPIQILILFLSMSLISIFLDELGFFEKVATWVLKKFNKNQYTIFVSFFILVSLLTMFTSNDIVILTLTPFIIFFSKSAKISPIPYLVSEFIAANTWSMMFIIGNPTNIYIAGSFGVDFVSYLKVMIVPTLVAGIAEFIILFILFRKKLKEPINRENIEEVAINKPLTIVGVSILLAATILLVISSYINLPMYLIALGALVLLLLVVLIYYLLKKEKPITIGRTLKRTPFELIPFLISMFAIVLAYKHYGIAEQITSFFGNTFTNITYGYSSLLVANLINNIPMSILYSSIAGGLTDQAATSAMYASIIGSNIGAFITPVGALAGIMWMGILKKHEVKYTFFDFIRYGLIVGIPVVTIAIFLMPLFIS